MRKDLIDITGRRFGRLLVEGIGPRAADGRIRWRCRCDCGETAYVKGSNFRSTRSCGCFKREPRGVCRSRLYRIWIDMRRRCSDPRRLAYADYGGRGIRVCAEWQASFRAFQGWAHANGYQDDLTIERADVNGSYSPANCSWIAAGDQALNTRKSVKAPSGELWVEVAKRNGVTASSFYNRRCLGWTAERAATAPLDTTRRSRTAAQRAAHPRPFALTPEPQ